MSLALVYTKEARGGGSAHYWPNSANWSQKPSDFPLRYSEGKSSSEMGQRNRYCDKITFTNFIHNFDLKYLGMKSNYVKIRQGHNVVDFKICRT